LPPLSLRAAVALSIRAGKNLIEEKIERLTQRAREFFAAGLVALNFFIFKKSIPILQLNIKKF